MKSKSVIQKAVLVLVSVLLSLFIAEIALHLFYPSGDELCVFPPRLHYELDPDPVILPGVSGHKHFDTDRLGIRKFDSENPDDYEVLFMGGSTTECMYLDNKEAWPYIASKTAKLKGGSIGKSGQTTVEHYMQLKYFVPQLKKLKTVVLMCGINDMLKSLAESEVARPMDQAMEDSMYSVCFTHTNRFNSSKGLRLMRLAHIAYRKLVADTTGQAVQDVHGYCYRQWREYRKHSPQIIDTIDNHMVAAMLHAYERNLHMLVDEAARKQVKLILVTQQTMWSGAMDQKQMDRCWMGGVGHYQTEAGHPYYSFDVLRSMMFFYNEVMRKVAKDRNVKCIVLDIPNDGEGDLMYDDCHWTVHGAALVGAEIGRHLDSMSRANYQ